MLAQTVPEFLITAVELLTEAVNILVLRVFRKDDYAGEIRQWNRCWIGDGSVGRSFGTSETYLWSGVLSRTEYEDAGVVNGAAAKS